MARQLTVHAQQASKNKTHLVLASRVELASIVTILDVKLGLVDEAGDHPILNETRIKSVSQCQVIDE